MKADASSVHPLLQFARSAEGMADRDAILAGFLECLAPYGIKFLIFVTVDQSMSNRYLWSNVGIHAHPDADAVIDPFLTYCCSAYAPTYTGQEFIPDYPYLSEAEERFIREAGARGFLSGIAFPVSLDDQGRFGGFNLGTGLERQAFLDAVTPFEDKLALTCVLVARALEALPVTGASSSEAPPNGQASPSPVALTRRDEDILFLLSQGQSRMQIAQTTSLTLNTVNSYIKALYAKLGVNNRAQATRLALQMGLRPPQIPDANRSRGKNSA